MMAKQKKTIEVYIYVHLPDLLLQILNCSFQLRYVVALLYYILFQFGDLLCFQIQTILYKNHKKNLHTYLN